MADSPFGRPLKKSTLVTEVADRLRARIIGGLIKPGVRLGQETLAQALGTSRTPLREALRLLAEEGFLEKAPNGQYAVIMLDRERLKELYLVRRELDGLAAELAAARRTRENLALMEEDLDEMVLADAHSWMLYHQHFHYTVYEASHNPFLMQRKHVVSLSTQMFYPQLLTSPTRRDDSLIEQRMILKAIRERDAERARSLARDHITSAMRLL
jgi:DNA-binding GntR family transcriptional regulator